MDNYTFDFEAIQNETVAMGETNDCFVKASSLGFGLTYMEAHTMLSDFGRKFRCGTPWPVVQQMFKTMVKDYGYQLSALTAKGWEPAKLKSHKIWLGNQYDGSQGKTIRTFARENTKGTFLVFTRAHITTIVDGVVQDWVEAGRGDQKRIIMVFRVR